MTNRLIARLPKAALPLQWSSDGQIFTYAIPSEGGIEYRCLAYDLRNRKHWLIFQTTFYGPSPVWSAHDRYAAFGLPSPPTVPAQIVAYGSHHSTNLVPKLTRTNGYGPYQSMMWSPRGNLLAYTGGVSQEGHPTDGVWVARLNVK